MDNSEVRTNNLSASPTSSSSNSFSSAEKLYSKKKIKKIFLLIVVLIVFLFSIVFFLFFIINNYQPTSNSNLIICSEDFRNCLSESPSPQDAIDSFQKNIDNEQNQEQKSSLYSHRSETLFESYSQDLTYKEQILNDALSADDLNPTSETAYRLYDLYSFYGDNERANYYINQSDTRGSFKQ